MKIWHVYLVGGMQPVNGVVAIVGRLCRSLEALGHDVRFLVLATDGAEVGVDVESQHLVERHGDVVSVDRRLRQALGAADAPDVVHFHEVMRPPHRLLAHRLSRAGVPAVTTTHGGLSPGSLARDRWKKAPYAAVVERRFLPTMASIVVNSDEEAANVGTFLGRRAERVPVVALPNPVAPELLTGEGWTPHSSARPRIVTLSRYDVRQKGLDVMAQVAREVPEADFVVHGMQCKNEPERTDALVATAPPNFALKPPCYGEEKLAVLRHADLFIQPSRWEGLSAALCEAMALGVPVAVSSAVAAITPVAAEGLGVVLDDDPAVAAAQVRAALVDEAGRAAWGAAARAYAARRFAPAAVAAAHVDLYERITRGPARTSAERSGRPGASDGRA